MLSISGKKEQHLAMFFCFSIPVLNQRAWFSGKPVPQFKKTKKLKKKKNLHREFPGGLVGRTWHFHGSGLGSIPDCGMKIPQAIQCGQ